MHQTHQCTKESQLEKTLESQPTNTMTFTCESKYAKFFNFKPIRDAHSVLLTFDIFQDHSPPV